MAIRITYNGQNIDLNIAPDSLKVNFTQERKQARAKSGAYEQINLYGIEKVEFDACFPDAVYYSLIAWWSWARKGKTFSFAFNSAETGNTTLDGSAAAAQKTIPLTATAAFSAGDVCLIASDDDDEFEVVVIDSVSAGVSVTAESNLVYGYASGDSFRHLDYWPSVVHTGERFAPSRRNDTWRWKFEFEQSLV